jgi:hypothetical protein
MKCPLMKGEQFPGLGKESWSQRKCFVQDSTGLVFGNLFSWVDQSALPGAESLWLSGVFSQGVGSEETGCSISSWLGLTALRCS